MRTRSGWKIISLCVTLNWLLDVKLSSAYYQTYVDGYTFSLPDFDDLERRNQANAQTWCTGNQSKLLEIASDDIQRLTVSFINKAKSQNLITGNTVITNGKRFDSGFKWVNGIDKGAGISVKGQDRSFSNSCGHLNITPGGFELFADTPTLKRRYICEGSSFCTNNEFRKNGRCYISFSETLSWYEARNRCIEGGGDLASFDFITTDSGFNSLNGSGWNPPSTYWIGIRRQWWTWQGSGSDVRYSQWSDGHPDYNQNTNKECLCLDPHNPILDWKWNECDCNQVYHFVCMTGPTTSSTSRSTVSTTTSATTTVKGPTQLENSSSSASNSGSKSTATSTIIRSGSIDPEDRSLAIGLGVGIGGGALIAVIIVIVFVVIRRKGCYGLWSVIKSSGSKEQSRPPDVTPESHYAKVVKFDNTTTEVHSIQNQTPTEYADLNIVADTKSSSSSDTDLASLVVVQSQTATLLPSSDANEPEHFVVNGATYAGVKQK